ICLLAAAFAPWFSRRARVGSRLSRLVAAEGGSAAVPRAAAATARQPVDMGPILRAAARLLLELGPILGGALVGLLLTRSLVPAVLAGVLAMFVVRFIRQTISDKRRHLLEEQMIISISLMAGGLRAGYSLRQALQKVAQDGPEPTAQEFARAM